MAVSLYDFSVVTYLQGLNALAGVLEKGRSHCEEKAIALDDMVGMKLIDDMLPFRFQVISAVHHSLGAIKGLEAGEFSPPAGYGELDYAGLQNLVRQAAASLGSLDRATVNAYVGKTLIFRLGGNELPFTAEHFIASFSLPNFFFHATTAYDMLRMRGAPLGKRDFLGALRMGA